MRFAHPVWLFGSLFGLLIAALLVLGAWLAVRASRRFGDDERVRLLVTHHAANRRALKGVLLVLALAVGFVAAAQPQYGRGTRLVPATNLDVVIALDYSKSMHARDVTPSRTERAKVEVARLIHELAGARVGAIAFAGEPLAFPLTSDGAAIAQFFRQMAPEDMPIGGTAIGRALGAALDLFRRDPLSARHRRVIVLVTDGEDLEGDPVSVAENAAKDGITIHVVQIGGRSPEPIPDIDEHGKVLGWRKGSDGQPLTTALTAEGEAQLGKIAEVTGGNVVRSERGNTGITEITASMRRMMTEELTDKVETVYADVYVYPLALAFLLLVLETFVPEVERGKRRKATASVARAAGVAALFLVVSGCQNGPFTRHSPVVDQALSSLDAGDPAAAASALSSYLSTGECKDGELGIPDPVRAKPNASVDLGIALFRIAERYGAKFGDMSAAPAVPQGADPSADDKRKSEVNCALRVVRVAGEAPEASTELRAQASYLAGNLQFLQGNYEDAAAAYEAALRLFPALPTDRPDALGVKAAWNRAIALRLIEEQKKKPDAGQPPPPDGGEQEQHDSGSQDKKDDQKQPDDKKGDQKQPDDKKGDQKQPNDESGDDKKPDEKKDDKGQAPKPDPQQRQEPPSPQKHPSPSQDERMLNELEDAPTVQEEAAKKNAGRVRVRGMEDK